jgi:hypothetical protein
MTRCIVPYWYNYDIVKMCVEIYLDIHTSSAKQRLRLCINNIRGFYIYRLAN